MLDKSIHICHSICQAVEFIHARQDSFGCQRFPLAHRDIKVFDRPNDRPSLNQGGMFFRVKPNFWKFTRISIPPWS